MDARLVRWSSTFGARGAGGALRGGGGRGAGGGLRLPGAVLLLARPAQGSVSNMQEDRSVSNTMGTMQLFFFTDSVNNGSHTRDFLQQHGQLQRAVVRQNPCSQPTPRLKCSSSPQYRCIPAVLEVGSPPIPSGEHTFYENPSTNGSHTGTLTSGRLVSL